MLWVVIAFIVSIALIGLVLLGRRAARELERGKREREDAMARAYRLYGDE